VDEALQDDVSILGKTRFGFGVAVNAAAEAVFHLLGTDGARFRCRRANLRSRDRVIERRLAPTAWRDDRKWNSTARRMTSSHDVITPGGLLLSPSSASRD